MSWLWLFTAVLVLILGPSWSRPAGAAECEGVEHGRVLQDGDARAGAGVSGRRAPTLRRGTRYSAWTPLHNAARAHRNTRP